MTRATLLAGAAYMLAGVAQPALAQPAGEIAATKADDAFGTSTGGEQISICSPAYARAFSASEAGNICLDGFYLRWAAPRYAPYARWIRG